MCSKETTEILENARFPVHKWESNLPKLETDNRANLSKILGQNCNKKRTHWNCLIQCFTDEKPVMQRAILCHPGSINEILPANSELKQYKKKTLKSNSSFT